MMTELGGAVAVPIAVRRSDSTTTIRVNEVIMIRIDGAIESTVSSAMSWMARSVTPPCPPPRLMLMSWANAGAASVSVAIRKVRNARTLRGRLTKLTKTMTSDGPAARPSRLQGFRSWSWRARERAGARHALHVEAGTRARPAVPPRWRARRVGEAQLRDAAPSRRDFDRPNWRAEGPAAVAARAGAAAV